jgi:hypothetical protein
MHVDGLLVPKKAFNFAWFVIGQGLVGQLISSSIAGKPLHLPEGSCLLWCAMGFHFVNGFDRGGHL